MYLLTGSTLGEKELPSRSGALCPQDEVSLTRASEPDSIVKNLDDFAFRGSGLTYLHRSWIRNRLVPAILASWRTAKPVRTVMLVGHADEVGDPMYNYRLAKDRARAVAIELRAQLEVKRPGLADQINVETFSSGKCWPEKPTGRREAANRRVQVVALKEEVPQTPPKQLTIDWEKMREWLRERDEARKYNKPIPPPPPGTSARGKVREKGSDFLRSMAVPQSAIPRVLDYAEKGFWGAASEALKAAGLGAQSEAIVAGLKAIFQVSF